MTDEQPASPISYYSAEGGFQSGGNQLSPEPQVELPKRPALDEMVMVLVGAILVIFPLMFVRLKTDSMYLPATVMLAGIILSGMTLISFGWWKQRSYVKTNAAVTEYQERTYDTRFQDKIVTIKDSERKSLKASVITGLVIGSLELAVILYALTTYALSNVERFLT
jgi:hypothetical protein